MRVRNTFTTPCLCLILLIVFVSTPAIVVGQSAASADRANRAATSYDDVIRVDTNLVTIPATVMDREGRYVTSLDRSDFRVFEDGVYDADTLAEIRQTFDSVAEELRHQYSLGYYPTNPLQMGRRQIKVKVDPSAGMIVHARDSYIVDKKISQVKSQSASSR